MRVDVRVPQLSVSYDSSREGVICKLNVSNGQFVEVNRLLCEIETDSMFWEVPAPEQGIVRALKARLGQRVRPEEYLLQIAVAPHLTIEPEAPKSNVKPTAPIAYTPDQRVFVVHGHDQSALQIVARTIERLGLEPVVLHEQLNRGRTIIEKFEHFAKNAGFAVVLMTPDDLGGKSAKALSRRARQNVLLELGYFMGLLGRQRVLVLTKDYVEIPSDYLGVVYTDMDAGGAWRLALARELKGAGMTFDDSRLLRL